MKKAIILFCLYLISINSFATSNQEVISINSSDNQSTPKTKTIELIKEQIKNKYNINIKINADQQYSDKLELEALELGLTNMVIVNSSSLLKKYNLNDYEVFELPFLFRSLNDFNIFSNSLIAEDMLREINHQNKNIYGLSYWAKDYKQIESNSLIASYSDIKNLSLVLEDNQVNKLIQNNLTKNTNNKNLTEIKESNSSNNLIYSFMLSLSDFDKYKIYEYHKNVLLTYHGIDVDVVLVNKRWFNKLSTEAQIGIIDIIKKAGLDEEKLMLQKNADLVKSLKAKNIQINNISQKDRLEFRKDMVAIHRYYWKNINPNLLVNIYKLFDK